MPALAGTAAAGRPPDPDPVPVAARSETPALFDDEAGGGADGDDPAIWVHPNRPGRSLVLVAKKDAGRSVYDLAVVTDRGRDQLRAFAIDPGAAAVGDTPLADVTAADAPLVFSADQAEVNEQATAYGLATWHDRHGGAAWAFVSRRHRRVVARALLVDDGGRVTYAWPTP